jgi:Arylsulfotransferase (ASST)
LYRNILPALDTLAIIIFVFCLIACDPPDKKTTEVDDDDTTVVSPPATQEITKLDYYLNPRNTLSFIVEVESDMPGQVYVEYVRSENELLSKRTPEVHVEPDQNQKIVVLGLLQSTEYKLKVVITADNDQRTESEPFVISTGEFPGDWLKTVIVDYTSGDGWDKLGWNDKEVFCLIRSDTAGENMYFCLNRYGAPVWYYTTTEVTRPALSFTPLSDGTFVGNSYDRLFFFNNSSEDVEIYDMDFFSQRTSSVHHSFDHECIEITEGPWTGAVAFMTNTWAYITHPVYSNPVDPSDNIFLNFPYTLTEPVIDQYKVQGIIVFDPQTEEVLWDWSMAYNEEITDSFLEKMPYTRLGLIGSVSSGSVVDWTHANDINHGIDENGQFFWISVRHQDWLIKLSAPEGELVWRFGYRGDFTLVDDINSVTPNVLPDEKWMYHQHAPEFNSHSDGLWTFMLFDNGNIRKLADGQSYSNPYSRVVQYTLDEHSMTAEIDFNYGCGPGCDEHFYIGHVGDADMQPDGRSAIFYDESGPRIAEISYPDGQLLWELLLNQFDAYSGYRVDYYPSIYQTTWRYE